MQALFDLGHPTTGPFPSNWFTVFDDTQNTWRRVHLPYPDCEVYVSDCQDIAVLNALDGFNLQPRLSVPFSGPIDVNSVNYTNVFLVSLGSTTEDEGFMPRGYGVGIKQVVWDVATNTLHVESDELLAQHTRFALYVTTGVRDADGDPVGATEAFRTFRQTVQGDYREHLHDAMLMAGAYGFRERDIAVASVFTTQSATAVLEKIRDQIHAAAPEPADFLLGPKAERTVFPLDGLTGITFNQQISVDPPLTPIRVPIEELQFLPGAVGGIAFGKYFSPDYEVHPGEFIPPVGTRTGMPRVQGVNEIYFNLYLPSGPLPAGGWPVAIFGTAAQANKNINTQRIAATMAAHGIATIGINNVGNGFGPLGTLTVNQTGGSPVTFPAGGRGIDQDRNGVIGADEGAFADVPRSILRKRDAQRQTVADFMQLVRVIELGMDVEGDGVRDADPSRIYYVGTSFSGFLGAQFLAIESSVRAGVLTVAGGPEIEVARLSPVNRSALSNRLAARRPSLINSPGITSLDGVPVVATSFFNENKPLRNGTPLAVCLEGGTSLVIQAPVINTVAGAMAIQEVLENTEWAQLSGDALAYAPHLRKSPLPGVPAKSVIVQFAKGDRQVINPAGTALLRASDLADRATFYRNDLAFAEEPQVPRDPHTFLVRILDPVLLVRDIARGAQRQIAVFFASDGKTIIHPEPARFFEVPLQGPLPEGLNYLP